ncbi:MAG: hypothetical protein JKX81_03335 [Arenicella sp.]|nr:hypothetical protein [Arenicella sp.]
MMHNAMFGKKPAPSGWNTPGGLAGKLLDGLRSYEFDIGTVAHYDKRVQEEIAKGITDISKVMSPNKSKLRITVPFTSARSARDRAINCDDPLKRDQAIWGLVDREDMLKTMMKSIEHAPNEDLAVSALLALQHCSREDDLASLLAFLEEVGAASNSSINLAEWARLVAADTQAAHYNDHSFLDDPISNRPVVHLADKQFDVTLPLLFQCKARTTIGGIVHETRISPTWFKEIFGDAMACVNADTFQSNLVLEKYVGNLHADGSAHYEHFPFTGTTDKITPSLNFHNYWSQIHRPFYTSGLVEHVTERKPVITNVPMTFARLAVTAAYDKYAVDDVALPESVRGVFFGYGHVEPVNLLRRGPNLRAGDFQISSRINPHTNKLANTQYVGTFFGKIRDTDEQGRLVMNARPTHCDADGKLDYDGDGSMRGDPVRPNDWCL